MGNCIAPLAACLDGWFGLLDVGAADAAGKTASATAPPSPRPPPSPPPQHTTPAGNPLPPIVHLVLKANRHGGPRRASGRVIVAGDVHGCDQQLGALLSATQFDARRDVLVCAGDLVSKGPDSLAVLRRLRGMGAAAIAARGNHDDAALAAYVQWKRSGAPPPPLYAFVTDLTPKDADYLASLPFTVRLPEYGVAVAHAGLVPGIKINKQDLRAVTTMRLLRERPDGSFQWCDGDRMPTPLDSVAWAEAWGGPNHVVFGHDSRLGLQLAPYATGVDTDAWRGGRLTACVLPPLAALSQEFADALKRGYPITRELLQATIVSVPGAAAAMDPAA